MAKEVKVIPPEGYEIDRENSTFECIRFKPVSVCKNTITRFLLNTDIYINGNRALVLFEQEREGKGYSGQEVSGHLASGYLARDYGDWFDGNGNKINGYIFYKPRQK